MVQKEMKIEAQPCHTLEICIHPQMYNTYIFTSTKISLFGPYCAISETLQNFNIFLEFFHFGTAELICQNKVLGVVGGVLGWNTLLIFQSLF